MSNTDPSKVGTLSISAFAQSRECESKLCVIFNNDVADHVRKKNQQQVREYFICELEVVQRQVEVVSWQPQPCLLTHGKMDDALPLQQKCALTDHIVT